MNTYYDDDSDFYFEAGDPVPFPLCQICCYAIQDWRVGPKLTPGMHTSNDIMSDKTFFRESVWYRYYRMILSHPAKGICRLSGLAYWPIIRRSSKLRAPWNTNNGFVPSKNAKALLCAEACVHEPERGQAEPPRDRLTGFPFHARCWQMLCSHTTTSRVSNTNLQEVLGALRAKRARDGELEWKPKMRGSWSWTISKGDPFHCPGVLKLIRRARRMTGRRFKVLQRTRGSRMILHRLPLEIHCEVANFLDGDTVVSLQMAMGYYLGDSYWRSRIPTDFFHEVRDVMDETLDWEFLSSELELLVSRYRDDNLSARRWVLQQLDEVAEFLDGPKSHSPKIFPGGTLESVRVHVREDIKERWSLF